MTESIAFTSSIYFQSRNAEKLKQFRNGIVFNRKARYNKQFYVTRNLPVPDEPETVGEQEDEKNESIKDSCCSPGPVRWGYKNVYATSISFMLVFSAFVGLQNLQSSLNATLGTTSLALVYGFFLLVGFVTPGMVRALKTKYSLLFGYTCHIIYILSNFYPQFYTLVPSSILLGIGSGPVWAGLSTHLASVAVLVEPYKAESLDVLISKFTGLFFFIFQLTQILGNLVSSLVLFPYRTDNTTDLLVTSDICDNDGGRGITAVQNYTLLSIYVAFDLLGIAVLLFAVDKLPEDMSMGKMQSKVKAYCAEPFVKLLKVLFSRNMLLLGPISLYNGMELSFAYSSFTQDIISNCVGVSKVGFALIVLGFFSATMSIIYGKAVKHIHRLVMASLAVIINLFFLLFLQFYALRPNYPLIFLFAIFWGIADGIWNTLTASIVGFLFQTDQESGFSAFRIWMSMGFVIGFVITMVKVLSHRLWIMVAVLIPSYLFYCLLEILLLCSKKPKTVQQI